MDVYLRCYTHGIIPLYYTTLGIVHCIIHHRMDYGPSLMIITTTPSKVIYLHCTRIRQGQTWVSTITRWPHAFIVNHEFGWANTRSRPGLPFYSIRNNSIQIATTRDTKFCKWLQQLYPDSDEVELDESNICE